MKHRSSTETYSQYYGVNPGCLVIMIVIFIALIVTACNDSGKSEKASEWELVYTNGQTEIIKLQKPKYFYLNESGCMVEQYNSHINLRCGVRELRKRYKYD